MSKGSRQRPRYVDRVTFESNWDKIFGKKVKNEKEENSGPDAHKNRKGSTGTTQPHTT